MRRLFVLLALAAVGCNFEHCWDDDGELMRRPSSQKVPAARPSPDIDGYMPLNLSSYMSNMERAAKQSGNGFRVFAATYQQMNVRFIGIVDGPVTYFNEFVYVRLKPRPEDGYRTTVRQNTFNANFMADEWAKRPPCPAIGPGSRVEIAGEIVVVQNLEGNLSTRMMDCRIVKVIE